MMQEPQSNQTRSKSEPEAQANSLTPTSEAQLSPPKKSASPSLETAVGIDESSEQTQQTPKDVLNESQQIGDGGNELCNMSQDENDYHQLYLDTKAKLEQTQRSLQESIDEENQFKKDVQKWAQRYKKLEKAMQRKRQQTLAATAIVQTLLHKSKDIDEFSDATSVSSNISDPNEEQVAVVDLMEEKQNETSSCAAAEDVDNDMENGDNSPDENNKSGEKSLHTDDKHHNNEGEKECVDQPPLNAMATYQKGEQDGQAMATDVSCLNNNSESSLPSLQKCDNTSPSNEIQNEASDNFSIVSIQQTEYEYKSNDQKWEEMFTKLKVFKQQNGHCTIPYSSTHQRLARWFKNQRELYNKNALPADRRRRMESIEFLSDKTNVFEKRWEEIFDKLVNFKEIYGHCNVPYSCTDQRLARWVKSQRFLYNKNTLSADRVERLESIGFVWKGTSKIPSSEEIGENERRITV